MEHIHFFVVFLDSNVLGVGAIDLGELRRELFMQLRMQVQFEEQMSLVELSILHGLLESGRRVAGYEHWFCGVVEIKHSLVVGYVLVVTGDLVVIQVELALGSDASSETVKLVLDESGHALVSVF